MERPMSQEFPVYFKRYTSLVPDGDIIDIERVFAYRALCFARDISIHQPPYDHDVYAENASYHERSLMEIAEEYKVVRDNSIIFFRTLDEEITHNMGSASDYKMSLRTIPFIIAGH